MDSGLTKTTERTSVRLFIGQSLCIAQKGGDHSAISADLHISYVLCAVSS